MRSCWDDYSDAHAHQLLAVGGRRAVGGDVRDDRLVAAALEVDAEPRPVVACAAGRHEAATLLDVAAPARSGKGRGATQAGGREQRSSRIAPAGACLRQPQCVPTTMRRSSPTVRPPVPPPSSRHAALAAHPSAVRARARCRAPRAPGHQRPRRRRRRQRRRCRSCATEASAPPPPVEGSAPRRTCAPRSRPPPTWSAASTCAA